ncbi:hypothetical protein [Marivita sp.]|uniref:hypothetical protein n=1 Tax=Marivita sp. TaxID=2003365 RepID=UPI003F6DA2A7
MVSERAAAKQAASNQEDDDPELDAALKAAKDHQLAIKKEDNRHTEKINQQNMGKIGSWVGDGKSVPTVAALSTIVLGFLTVIGLYIAMFTDPENGELYSSNAERAFGVAAAALAYLFGKSSK